MPSNSYLAHRLPQSFRDALEEARTAPLSYVRKDGTLAFLPFVGGGAPEGGDGSGGAAGGEGGTESGEGDAGAERPSEGSGAGSGADADDADDDVDGQGDLPDNIKEILRKNRKATRDAERRAQAAQQAAEAATAKAKQYEDRDKSALEKAEERAAEAEKEATKLRDDNKVLALRTAFLAEASVKWVDPEDALEMALRKYGLRDLELTDTGTVKDKKALGKLIKEMASEKEYLVDKGQGGKDDQGGRGASGGSFNGGKSGGKGKDPSALARKYPAMAGRRKAQ